VKIEISNRTIELFVPSLLDSNRLRNKIKGSFVSAILEIIKEVSLLDEREVLELSITEAIFILVSYRAIFYNDIPIYESEDEKIFPIELINDSFKRAKEQKYFIIDGEQFSTFLPMADAIQAEEYARKNAMQKDFPILLQACCCVGGFQKGLSILTKKGTATPINRGGLYELLNALETDELVRLNIRGTEYNPILLQTNLMDKRIKEFPFRSSRLFDL